jgi:hypothetical protein
MSCLVDDSLRTLIEINTELSAIQEPALSLPHELILEVFRSLSMNDLCKASCVCREWKILASYQPFWDIKQFSSLTILDKVVWEKNVDLVDFQLRFRGLPPIDKRILHTIEKLSDSLQVEGNVGLTLLAMPGGLTYRKMKTLAKLDLTRVQRCIKNLISEEVRAPYWLIMTNAPLKGSRDLLASEQETFVKENGCGCTMTRLLPTLTLCILTDISLRGLRYGKNTYTYCSDLAGHCTSAVGHFTVNDANGRGSLSIEAGILAQDRFSFDDKEFGIGVMKQL